MEDARKAALFVVLDGNESVRETAHFLFGGGHGSDVLRDTDDGPALAARITQGDIQRAAGFGGHPRAG